VVLCNLGDLREASKEEYSPRFASIWQARRSAGRCLAYDAQVEAPRKEVTQLLTESRLFLQVEIIQSTRGRTGAGLVSFSWGQILKRGHRLCTGDVWRLGEDRFDREHGRPGELHGVEFSMQLSGSDGAVVQPEVVHDFIAGDVAVTDVLVVERSNVDGWMAAITILWRASWTWLRKRQHVGGWFRGFGGPVLPVGCSGWIVGLIGLSKGTPVIAGYSLGERVGLAERGIRWDKVDAADERQDMVGKVEDGGRSGHGDG
jgi:hypothetical protein